MGLAWILFGALIGVSASQRRGFGTAGGVIGGMLLGPLAVLMYFASSNRLKCPQCAEWINKEAKLCPHCKSNVNEKLENESSSLLTEEQQKLAIDEMEKKSKKKVLTILAAIWIAVVFLLVVK
ncbi:MAG: hypothetical protein Q7T96_18345 [Methylobacter sp.]|nr:hypothetical protein [Methylobacter sp.]